MGGYCVRVHEAAEAILMKSAGSLRIDWRIKAGLLMLFGLSASAAVAGVTDPNRVLTEPAMSIPTAGVTYADPAFGTATMRLVDAKAAGLGMMVPEYSQLQAWNADMTLLLVRTGRGLYILDAKTFSTVHQVDFKWPASGSGLRWSPTEPLVLYYTGGDCTSGAGCQADDLGQQCGTGLPARPVLRRYRLVRQSTGFSAQREMVGCFTEYASFNRDASFEELSDDGRYVALVGQRTDGVYEAFAYDIVTRVKGLTLALPASLDWAAMAPSGRYVVIQYSRGFERYQGLEAYDRDTMTYAGKVYTGGGHGDLTRDADGTDVFVATNANNAYLLSDAHYLVKAKIPQGVLFDTGGNVDRAATVSSGATVPLLKLDWFHNLHISCRNHKTRGWCVVGTASSQEGFDNGWQPFEDELFQVYLDSRDTTPHVERLAHHRSSPNSVTGRDSCAGTSNYWAQPHATASPDGTRILFGSNWGRICDASEPSDAFMLFLSAPGPLDSVRPSAPTRLRVQ